MHIWLAYKVRVTMVQDAIVDQPDKSNREEIDMRVVLRSQNINLIISASCADFTFNSFDTEIKCSCFSVGSLPIRPYHDQGQSSPP